MTHICSHFCPLLSTYPAAMAATDSGPEASGSRSSRLKAVLQQIHAEDCPKIPNPPGCRKRASVALALRVRPIHSHQPVYDRSQCSSVAQPFQECLDSFFSQEWVQEGDAEVLFIKRAARVGDRWTSHTALPGGKREALTDVDDRATSSRETREEVGLDLDVEHVRHLSEFFLLLLFAPSNKHPHVVILTRKRASASILATYPRG